MKKILLFLPLCAALTFAKAQTSININDLNTSSQEEVSFDSLLQTMSKMQLTNLYLDEVTKLAFNSPYAPFTIGVSDTINGDLDIPVSKYIKNKRDEILVTSKQYGDVMKEQLYEIIPYSDKKDMIRAILFLRNINTSIRK